MIGQHSWYVTIHHCNYGIPTLKRTIHGLMKTLKLLLLPQPGATAEYLDDVEIVNPNTTALQIWNEQLVTASRGEAEGERNQLTLEGYTRDSWPWKPVAEENVWLTITVRSITGRQKLSGFCDYLKQRQKSCYGRFPPRGVFVVTYTQQRPSAQAAATSSQQMECRIAVDMTKIAKCTLKPIESNVQMVSHQPPPVQPTPPPPTEESVLKSTKSSRGGGLLGKLVGAQQRTNQHVVNSTTATTGRNVSTASLSAGVISNTDPSMEDQQRSLASFRTAQDVLAEFRQAMQDKMLDFDISDDEELKVTISLAEYTTGLSVEDKSKVTMEILKYMVYEAAEEVNEEWVTYKEPSEFMDEVVIAVYKEGAAPPDVLEEINKGELPDEVRAQQRAIQEQRHRHANQAERHSKQDVERDVHRWEAEDGAEDFAVLNTNKRDRRTIEDYEREKSKRSRDF